MATLAVNTAYRDTKSLCCKPETKATLYVHHTQIKIKLRKSGDIAQHISLHGAGDNYPEGQRNRFLSMEM